MDRPAGLIVALCLAAGPAAALEPVGYALDGDTIVMLSGEIVRIENVDTPEINCMCARECRLALRAFSITRDATAGGVDLVRRPRPDRYGRTLARVVLPDGRDLGALLIASGFARAWDGRRRPWCS